MGIKEDVKFKGEEDMNERKYQTWEVIKTLEENPKLEFKCLKDDAYYDTVKINENNQVAWGGKSDYPMYVVIGENLLWVLKKQPVDFMTAVKAYDQGKTVCCEVKGREFLYIPSNKMECSSLGYLVKSKAGSVSTKEILQGTWYIKD